MRKESKRCYIVALKEFLSLGSALEFSAQDITNAYNAKLVETMTDNNIITRSNRKRS